MTGRLVWVLLAHLGTISCRRTLPDKSLARTLSFFWCFRLCDWTRCSAGFKACTRVTFSFFFILCDFIHVFIMLQVRIFFHVIYKGLLQSVAHIHFERDRCLCSSVCLFVCSCWTIFCYRRDLVLPRSSCSCWLDAVNFLTSSFFFIVTHIYFYWCRGHIHCMSF